MTGETWGASCARHLANPKCFTLRSLPGLAGLWFPIANGNRRLPTIILLLGLVLTVLTFMGKAGYLGLAGIALLAAIIWIANKADTV